MLLDNNSQKVFDGWQRCRAVSEKAARRYAHWVRPGIADKPTHTFYSQRLKEAMKELDREKTIHILNQIMEFELAGVVRYTHYSLMVTGPHRIPIVQFFQAQANESLLHAQHAGEVLTGLEGHPSMRIAPIEETNRHDLKAVLTESLNHERKALELYKVLLDVVEDASVYLEEFARGAIGQEELHNVEIRKMLRDYV